MAKYFKASDYYPDDKDIYDFLDSQTRSTEPLLKFLKNRNILASKEVEKINLQHYISLLYFDWESANKLIDIIDIRDTEQKMSHVNCEIAVDPENVHSLINTIKNDRGDTRREVYQIQKHAEEIDIRVTYIDIDTSKTILLQKKEKEIQITASKMQNNWLFRHTDNDRAKEIVKVLIEKIGQITDQKDIPKRCIEIGHLNDNKKRVEFFHNTMTSMDGFRLTDVTNVKVDKLAKELYAEEEDEDLEVKEKIRKVIMYGIDLFTTTEYQNLVKQGFFISGAQWKSQKTDGKGEQVEFSAGFSSPIEGKDFAYKVLGIYRVDETGNLMKEREKVMGSEKKSYLGAIEASAINALNKINGEMNNETE